MLCNVRNNKSMDKQYWSRGQTEDFAHALHLFKVTYYKSHVRFDVLADVCKNNGLYHFGA